MQTLRCSNCKKFFTLISPQLAGQAFCFECKECSTLNELAVVRTESDGTSVYRVVGKLDPEA